MSSTSRSSIVSSVVFAILAFPTVGFAATPINHAAVLAPFLNDDTFAVAYLDVAELLISDANGAGKLLDVLPQLGDNGQASLTALRSVITGVENLRAAGIDAIYLVVGLADANMSGGPLLIFHINKSDQQDSAIADLKRLATALGAAGREVPQVRAHGADMVWVGSAPTLDRYAVFVNRSRDDLTEPLNSLASEGAVLAGAFAPGPDFRRVVRELWPTLPPPMTPLKGELADRWRTLEFAANLPPNVNPRLTLQTTEPESARIFVDLYRALPAAAAQFGKLGGRQEEFVRYLNALVAAMPPQVDGSRVTLNISTAGPQLEQAWTALCNAAMESGRRNLRMNRFKEMLIAMLNYADVIKHLPPAAICDKDGRPLLSWRVAVLPYMDKDEVELYKQFHLDEPWDSPHNRTLIEKMPDTFADPDPIIRRAAGDGKTTFQVPVAAETIFYNNQGTPYKEIADGTSKTILIVEVAPLRAVVWTKPEDWEVNMRHPRSGVERTDRDRFTAGFADAHTSTIPVEVDEATLRAMLTRAGREVYDWP